MGAPLLHGCGHDGGGVVTNPCYPSEDDSDLRDEFAGDLARDRRRRRAARHSCEVCHGAANCPENEDADDDEAEVECEMCGEYLKNCDCDEDEE